MSEPKGKKSFKLNSVTETMHHLVRAAGSMGLPFAMYRLPEGNENYYFQISINPVKEVSDVNLEELDKGFIFSKFDGEKYFLQADLSWDSSSNHLSIKETLNESPILEKLLTEINSDEVFPLRLPKKSAGIAEKSDLRFTELVKNSISRINTGTVEKIVPARAHLIEGLDESNVVSSITSLSKAYPSAFVSLFSSPETGSWLGATPELLVQTRQNKFFETVALAGTQGYLGQELKSVAWTQKEIEEQALVARYIINCFKKIRLREFDELGPKTVIAGNLLHLKTIFKVDMQETNFPELGSVMLNLLHPTSAVCGMPLEESLSFIRENEDLERRFYSGYLGPVNVDSQTNIFVNLRCLEYTQEGAKLYAGAGVTADSDPQSELIETELKFDTLRKIILPK